MPQNSTLDLYCAECDRLKALNAELVEALELSEYWRSRGAPIPSERKRFAQDNQFINAAKARRK